MDTRLELCFEIERQENHEVKRDMYHRVSVKLAQQAQREHERDIYLSDRADNKYSHACPKCGGTGYLRQYGHVSGGICFQCNGTGKRS